MQKALAPIRFLLCCLSSLALALSIASADSALRSAHQADTVNWRSWDESTLKAAQTEDKPLFFFVSFYGNSLGRAMLAETFQNKTIAATVNETTIPVLVDLNEEPELASLLNQMASEHFEANSWPICLWTNAKLAPLNGGGYFPPTDDWGGQGYLSLARSVSEQWNERREELEQQALERQQRSLQNFKLSGSQSKLLAEALSGDTFAASDAPNLPAIEFYNASLLLKELSDSESEELRSAMDSLLSLLASSAGFDSISGGFFVGSNDPNWRLPLFQKSSIDQALMVRALAEMHAKHPKPEYKSLIRLTVAFAKSDLQTQSGLLGQYVEGYAAGETPDLPEGSYYIFEPQDLDKLSGEAIAAWGLSPEGNLDENADILGMYQKRNVPFSNQPKALSEDFDALRAELQKIRSQKNAPLADTTTYTATNALWASALCRASEALGDSSFQDYAQTLFASVIKQNGDAQLSNLYNSNSKSAPSSSCDYALLTAAALDLHQVTGKKSYLETAIAIQALWSSDPRFNTSNPLLLPSGIEKITASNYLDASLPSAAAVQWDNLNRLDALGSASQNTAKLREALLTASPEFLKFAPQKYLSLLVALNKGQ